MLDTTSWQGFTINDLFNRFERGKANQTKLEDGDDTFYVGAKRDDNGVMLRCAYDKTLISDGNCMVFICNGQGSVGFANYMDRDFIASTDLVLGYADWLNADVGMFLATVFSLERPKYSFGRKWGRFLKDSVVQLPAESDGSGNPIIDPDSPYSPEGYIPDWHFMEDFIRSLHHKPLTTSNARRTIKLDQARWATFKVGDFFEIRPTKTYKGLAADDLNDGGQTPFVVNSSVNNGIGGFSTLPPTEDGNKITFSDTTDGNTFFYQPSPFIGFSHVQGMYENDKHYWTQEELLFLTTILTFDSVGRYNYGRKMTRETIRSRDVLLPVTPDREPDWQFMEDYIRSLPFGDRIPEVGEF